MGKYMLKKTHSMQHGGEGGELRDEETAGNPPNQRQIRNDAYRSVYKREPN